MSLDGFINDRNGDLSPLYPDLEALRQTEELQESIKTTGAVIMGRRAYAMGDPVGFEGYEYQVPIFVLTHKIPEKVATGENGKLSFNFVTDGIESAVKQAKAAAGDKDVTVVGGANTTQQLLKAGLFDEIHLSIMPILLGEGLSLFEHLGSDMIEFERISVRESPATIDIKFRNLRG